VLVYPGIYSLRGLKAITKAVPSISKVIVTQDKIKRLSFEMLKDKYSSKLSLFKITNRYLNLHRFKKELCFL
jgi:hypothetical protein